MLEGFKHRRIIILGPWYQAQPPYKYNPAKKNSLNLFVTVSWVGPSASPIDPSDK